MQKNDFARNFHLKPSRILQRIESRDSLGCLINSKNYISFCNKKILLIDSIVSFTPSAAKYPIDLLIVSKNPKLYISQLNHSLIISQIVFDGSVPAWKLKSAIKQD